MVRVDWGPISSVYGSVVLVSSFNFVMQSSRFAGRLSTSRASSGTAVRAAQAAQRVADARARAVVRSGNVPRPLPRPRGLAPERKAVDTTISQLNFDTSSAVANCMLLVNTVATGTLNTNRVGKRIVMRACSIRARVQAATATVLENCSLYLVYIRTPNQAATLPAVTDILTTQSSGGLTNRDNASKFRILRRWNFQVVGNSTTPSTGLECQDMDHYVPLPSLPAVWTAASTAGTISEFVEGALILLSVGQNANGATTTPYCTGQFRVYFSDA